MELGLQGTRAVVAASSAGLGLGVARALAAAGARVVVSGRDEDRLQAAAASVTGAVPVRADVSTTDGATAFVEQAAEQLGGVDVLVPNAGGPPAGNPDEVDLGGYRDALELNLLSTVAMCDAALPGMRERGWGRIVAITSISVREPMAQLVLSNTARAGVTAYLKTLAGRVAGEGVTVNSVQPGLHATDRVLDLGEEAERLAESVPVGRLGDPDDFGAVVAFLCSRQAGFVTGAAIPVDGGMARGLQ